MRAVNWLLDLLYPPRCPFCRSILKPGECAVCAKCDKLLPRAYKEDGRRADFVERLISPYYYEDGVREAVLRYKFGGVTACAAPLGKLLADCVREHLEDEYDLITWVPLSRQRLRSRGYDQARLLAEAAARELGTKAVATLYKHIDTPPQAQTGSEDRRRANITGAFEVIDKELIEGRRVLLIDDIVTTGATVSECARVLGKAGAETVYCASLARTRE